ncbi:hypothetical protein [Fulvimonas soli]|jgi:hypothetical protein|uniref:Uncharacterized protein n=1 Tax=Fulvimonas soli TaxID=155197 RepID=A0A316I7K8_9GAMM|nr:hypothetical protein C7456_10518 [Fulvimonas soli]
MPLAAAGQSLDGDTHALARQLLQRAPDQTAEVSPGVVVPLWRGSDGRMLALKADQRASGDAAQRGRDPLSFSVVDATGMVSTGLQYGVDPHLQLHADVGQRNWLSQPLTVYSGDVGATYNAGRYSMGLSVSATDTPHPPALPRVLPGAAPGVGGLPDFDGSTHLNAQGRVALDAKSGIDLGASVGRIKLLPGNLLGVGSLDQKALSFGVDRGPLSGAIVGRTLRPSIPGALNADRHWNSIDLGVTVRLPWQGELSIGAQNLWSSGGPINTPVGPEPDQSRTPYVQYHQDL